MKNMSNDKFRIGDEVCVYFNGTFTAGKLIGFANSEFSLKKQFIYRVNFDKKLINIGLEYFTIDNVVQNRSDKYVICLACGKKKLLKYYYNIKAKTYCAECRRKRETPVKVKKGQVKKSKLDAIAKKYNSTHPFRRDIVEGVFKSLEKALMEENSVIPDNHLIDMYKESSDKWYKKIKPILGKKSNPRLKTEVV